MFAGIEAYYQQIAESLIAVLPNDWHTATFEVIFYPRSSVYEAEYTRKSDGKAHSLLPSRIGHRAFQQLRDKFKDSKQPLWGKARFELYADGTFNMKWDYDNCDNNGNALFDEEAEVLRCESRRIRLAEG